MVIITGCRPVVASSILANPAISTWQGGVLGRYVNSPHPLILGISQVVRHGTSQNSLKVKYLSLDECLYWIKRYQCKTDFCDHDSRIVGSNPTSPAILLDIYSNFFRRHLQKLICLYEKMSSYIIQECKNVFVLIKHGSVKTSDDLPRKRWKSLGLQL